MLNITKTQNGYLLNGEEYILTQSPEILNQTQADVFTNKGVILIDTNITVDGQQFDTIVELLESIK
jgi:hypothetical protein